jgi:hypothetical protein
MFPEGRCSKGRQNNKSWLIYLSTNKALRPVILLYFIYNLETIFVWHLEVD